MISVVKVRGPKGAALYFPDGKICCIDLVEARQLLTSLSLFLRWYDETKADKTEMETSEAPIHKVACRVWASRRRRVFK